jgi:hypothetical protein
MGPESRERDVVREIKKKYDNARRVLLSSIVYLGCFGCFGGWNHIAN